MEASISLSLSPVFVCERNYSVLSLYILNQGGKHAYLIVRCPVCRATFRNIPFSKPGGILQRKNLKLFPPDRLVARGARASTFYRECPIVVIETTLAIWLRVCGGSAGILVCIIPFRW